MFGWHWISERYRYKIRRSSLSMSQTLNFFEKNMLNYSNQSLDHTLEDPFTFDDIDSLRHWARLSFFLDFSTVSAIRVRLFLSK